MRPDVGGIDFDREVNVPKKAKRFYVGDVLFSNLRPYFKKVFLAEDDGFCSSDVLVFRSDLESALLFYIISSDHFINTVSANMKGTRMPRGDKDTIVNYLIQVPKNVKEQEGIVEVLSGLDDVIDGVRGVLEKAEVVERGLYQRVFAESERWEAVEMEDVCENLDNKRVPITKSDRESGPIPYYGATGVIDYVQGYIFDEEILLIGEDGADWSQFAHTSFIVTGKSWVNNHAHVVRCSEKIMIKFLMSYINYSDLTRFTTGGTRQKMTKKALMGMRVPLPPIKKQKEIVEVFEAHEAYVRGYEEYLEKLERVKKALMQQLLSGQVRVQG